MLISIDEKNSQPIYQQLAGQIREQVSRGILKPGDELPSVRELSENLGINMHTARRAYLILRGQGIINLRLGRRARIASGKPFSPQGDVGNSIQMRLKELVSDALLTGISPDAFKDMVDKLLSSNEKTDQRE